MGIVNVTPDSFSDGGRFASTDAAIAHCERLKAEGADILDIGGESTRPGARQPSPEEELQRVLPVLRHALTLGLPVSVDTSEPRVMAAALELGIDIVNDVRALQRPEAIDLVASHPTCGICLMHMRGEPGTMQSAAQYDDVVAEVARFLAERASALRSKGVAAARITLDPGIGFAKQAEHNLELLRRQRELLSIGYPLLVGWSRKSTLGVVTGKAVGERVAASVAAALAAVQRGARIVRVHDVAATVDALKVWRAAGLGGQDNP
jgi:dihydropteroate synthase